MKQGAPSNQYLGKYRGRVTDNKDPENLGRIKAEVPAVYGKGEFSNWALPCIPYAGKNVGCAFIPDIDTHIWIEFENGNRDYPIWTGCYWAENEWPEGASPDVKVLKTKNITFTMDDTNSDSIKIENQSGMKISINSSEIELSNGTSIIKISGNDISINSKKINLN
jgi:uncharacterized protein involved in type VI secretion and phage assembly